MSTDRTPLQKAIKEAILEHPTLDDKEIAAIAFKSRYPDETWEGKDPSFAYVGKQRKRIELAGEAPEFIIEEPDEPQEPEPDLEEPTEEPIEPEIPFDEDFEPPIDADFEIPTIEEIEGFTPSDTEFILCFTFDKFADWSGYEGWRFKQDEQGHLIDKNEKRFSKLTHRMMEKYLPDIFELYFLEVMFCYTGIMLVGSKAKGYADWRKRNEPILKDVESTIVEPEKPKEEEIPEPEAEEQSTEDEPNESTAMGRLQEKRRRTQ